MKYVELENKTALVVIAKSKAKGTKYRREKKWFLYTKIKSYVDSHEKDTSVSGQTRLNKYQNGPNHEYIGKFSVQEPTKPRYLGQGQTERERVPLIFFQIVKCNLYNESYQDGVTYNTLFYADISVKLYKYNKIKSTAD